MDKKPVCNICGETKLPSDIGLHYIGLHNTYICMDCIRNGFKARIDETLKKCPSTVSDGLHEWSANGDIFFQEKDMIIQPVRCDLCDTQATEVWRLQERRERRKGE